ncbi:hypothetical protein HG536_0A05530 [Torulaspora globosa]|uniref:Kynurenine formamidase n=1 Tax=Torulaspora globosa TaxID=48254 RepID=A0A7G3ZB52_9SACH|nr:uncharacterized protein HG536_0A05530 [Torulaspora globosa]QLL30738.1 hypothetical protein HG536_0A05530 [Torulaspora globosa]
MGTDESRYGRTETFYRPQPSSDAGKALVFIHGGAWIDEACTPTVFKQLSALLAHRSEQELAYSLFSIDYRLSPNVRHPVHVQDVVENLYRLVEDHRLTSLQLVGHSVGATLAWQTAVADESLFPSLDRLNTVRSRLQGVFMVDGIYSLAQLLDEYPNYDYFVSQAFADYTRDFEEFEQSTDRLPETLRHIHLIHSYGDELLSLRQSNYMSSVLQKARISFSSYFDDMGLHDEVPRNAKLANYLLHNVKFA